MIRHLRGGPDYGEYILRRLWITPIYLDTVSVVVVSLTNYWTELSIDFANQRNYLDELFRVYPTIPEGIRDIDEEKWSHIEKAFESRKKIDLIVGLLELPLFPLKDSYVAYLRRDPSAISRNPTTVDRLFGRLCELGLDEIYERCSEPKETNRQIGPLFDRWLGCGTLGAPVVGMEEFESTSGNAILRATEDEKTEFARSRLNYTRDKGLDFVARYGGKYVIGEAKFLTDFGGHQNAQFSDAIQTIETPSVEAVVIGILDGVLYIKSNNKMYKAITTTYAEYKIMSALVLREFLFTL